MVVNDTLFGVVVGVGGKLDTDITVIGVYGGFVLGDFTLGSINGVGVCKGCFEYD